MDLIERLITLAIGGFLGYVLARIVDYLRDIKEEVDEIYEVECHKDEKGITRLRTVMMDSILLGVVLLVAWAAYSTNKANVALENDVERDKIAICKASAEQRNIDRRLVDAVYELAVGVTGRSRSNPPVSLEELRRYNQYIDQVNAFRDRMYDLIGPSDICLPYVTDENVKPPTPPAPHWRK